MGEAPYSETMVMRRKLDDWKVEAPRASMMTGLFLEAAVRPLLDLVDQIAALRTDSEIQDGMSGDDAAETIGSLVAIARLYSDKRPDPSTVYRHPDDDAYPMTWEEAQALDRKVRRELMREAVEYEPESLKALQRKAADLTTPAALRALEAEAEPDQRQLEDEAYGYSTGAKGDDCAVCKGTGEVIEYPPDDDERLVACTHCGGTGEAIR